MPPQTTRSTALHQTRRTFCATAAAAATSCILPRLVAQGNPTRPDVAAIDHDRIMREANRYLADPPTPITQIPAPKSPGGAHDYFSEAAESDLSPNSPSPAPSTAHRDAVFHLGLRVPCLAAAQWITDNRNYGDAAARHIRAWFVDPATRLTPALDYGSVPVALATDTAQSAKPPTGTYKGILETLPLVELVQAIPFLAGAGSLTDSDLAALRTWFTDYLHWLTAEQDAGARIAALARDHKDHHATSWMLQVAAYTLFTVPDTGGPKNEARAMTDLRHRFRSVTLRTQVSADGRFRNEISTPNPYRDSLFNLDMLACLCQLLSTRFESTWDYQLEDGPGMRVATAFHAAYIQDRAKWPYRADSRFFSDLPSRRPALLFAARAYARPEYATVWKSLPPDRPPDEILRTIPIHQPLLWVTQPHRQSAQGTSSELSRGASPRHQFD